jgi:predicted CxxxxCH...CXXCH cytochrome family protein
MDNKTTINNKGLKLWAKLALVNFCALASVSLFDSAFASNPIMHNSSTTTSKYGVWGQGRNCTWCHVNQQVNESTGNIKLVKDVVDTPTGTRGVYFDMMTTSSNSEAGVMGNDARSYAIDASTNICEVCHHQTTYHQYSSTKVTAGHYDNNMCTSCHLHADGFKPQGHTVPYYAAIGGGHPSCSTATGCHANVNPSAQYPTAGTAPDCRVCHVTADPTVATSGCGSCHGDPGNPLGTGQPIGLSYPNDAGSHAVHNSVWYVDHTVTCTDCHTSGGTGGKTDHGKGNRGTNPAIVNLDSAFGVSGVKPNLTCSTASCHASPYGSSNIPSPAWGTTVGCSACHTGDPGVFQGDGAPNTGSHPKHMAIAGSSCGQCHDGAVSGSTGGLNHLDTNIDVTGVGYPGNVVKHNAGSGYSSCSTASCHKNPYDNGSVVTPVWGQSAGCAACHQGVGVFAANGAPVTGSHAAHLAIPGSDCNQCHAGAAKGVSGGTAHTNDVVDVTNDYTGSPVTKHAPGTYGGYCLSASCHASPYDNVAVNSPVWGSSARCTACHVGAGAFTTYSAPNTGSHFKHMALNNATCGQCHAGAIAGQSGGNHHPNTFVNVTSGYTASPVTKHPIGTYGGTCANSCHTNGNGVPAPSPKWGVPMPANCSGCHGGDATVTPATKIIATGTHRSHMNNYSTLGRGNNLKCAECHAKTVSLASNTVITTSVSHINSYKDYSGAKAGGSSNYETASGVCSTVYCHSSGQAVPAYRNMTGSKAWGSTAKLDCNGCHGNEPGAIWNSGFGAPNYANHSTVNAANSHERHVITNGMADSRGCAKCHRNSVDMGVANKFRNYSSTHLNRSRDVAFSIYGIYSASTKSCTTYCHSNIQAAGGTAGATVYAKPAWGSSNGTMTCASCHKDIATLTETAENLQLGSHKRHTVDAGYSCSLCHGGGYNATGVVGATHADGLINVSFTGQGTGTTYSQTANNQAGDGYGTCSTSKCHGRATRNWGISTTLTECEKCHGSERTAIQDGVFKDTAGNPASSYAGTHVSHLAGTHNYMNPIACSECHKVPASINSFDHMTSLPATITWGAFVSHSSVGSGTKTAMTPSYSYAPGRTCSNTYCHAGVRNQDGSVQGSGPAPAWGDPGYLGGTGCGKCHGNPPPYPHTGSMSCNACHNHVDQSNVAFADKSIHINGHVETTVDECLGCHSSTGCTPEQLAAGTCFDKKLVGGHRTHTDAEMFLYNRDANGNILIVDGKPSMKKLSTGDYIDPAWIYQIKYKKGFPQYACGFCHPMDAGTHKNGIVELDLDPTHSLVGTVKTKNKEGGPWIATRTTGSLVRCNNVYCHSSGFVSETTQQFQFQQTPDWYYADKNGGTSPWDGLDNCAQCHGNSPNTNGKEGSTAHARHVVGNHYKDVFDGYSAKLKAAGSIGSGAVHGDPATSTNFNCNICHFDTVRVAYNDKGSVCIDCHSSTAPVKGNMVVYSSSTKHINGDIDVAFMEPFTVKSKAQLRNYISSVQSVYTSWTRVKGYKTYSSADVARSKPNYVGGTCLTTACHNGTQMEWRTKGPLDCAACHTGLPQ